MDGNTISVSNTNFDLIKPLPEPHALFSRTGEILYLNPACLKFLKLHQTADDPSTLFGGEQGELRRRLASWSASGQFTPQHLRVKVGDAWVACIGNGARVSVGESVGILVRLRPKQDAHKRFLELNRKVQELASEVEVRRRVELELREAEAKAVAASRAKDSLMANVSHELRTPMNGVLGMAELLLEKGLPQPQQEYAEAIRSSAEHLLEIVNSILDLSKLESGGIEPATVEFDPLHLVEEVLALLSHRASDGVQTAVLGDLPGRVRVQGAATSIRQILLNLVGNSLKFTSHGSVVVRCRVEQHCLYYDIQDSGIGIPADRLTDIFEPFSQIDRGASRKYQGTGLGLTITQRIVNLLNGCIAVESECDVGTTFRLEIPIVVTATESQVVHQRGKALLLSPRRFPLEDVLPKLWLCGPVPSMHPVPRPQGQKCRGDHRFQRLLLLRP